MTTLDNKDTLFQMGDLVKKKGDKGQWHGKIVGTYSATCTPVGYAVESLLETGSVQIYPESALEPWEGQAGQTVDVEAIKLIRQNPIAPKKGIRGYLFDLGWRSCIDHLVARGLLKSADARENDPRWKETLRAVYDYNMVMSSGSALETTQRIEKAMPDYFVDGISIPEAPQADSMKKGDA